MSEAVPCLRRTEPSAALIPRVGQPRLAYVPAAVTDIRPRGRENSAKLAESWHPMPVWFATQTAGPVPPKRT